MPVASTCQDLLKKFIIPAMMFFTVSSLLPGEAGEGQAEAAA